MSLPPETELSNPMPWVDGATRVFGVIAHPVDHVRAPMVFNPRFAAAGLPHIMVPINAPPEKLETHHQRASRHAKFWRACGDDPP